MSNVIQEILKDKESARKRLSALPIAAKLSLLEKMRDRGMVIASNPLRKLHETKPQTIIVVHGHEGQNLWRSDVTPERSKVLKRPIVQQRHETVNFAEEKNP